MLCRKVYVVVVAIFGVSSNYIISVKNGPCFTESGMHAMNAFEHHVGLWAVMRAQTCSVVECLTLNR